MPNMLGIDDTTQTTLANLAARLRELRLARNETQAVMAARLGISRETYRKLERGDASTAIGHWLTAARILGRLGEWDRLFAPAENLFEQYERSLAPRRQRASKRRRPS